MRPGGLLMLSLALLSIGCADNDRLDGFRNELSLSEIKLILASGTNQNNLITKIEQLKDRYVIHRESGDPIPVEIERIRDIHYDSANWLLTFSFSDHSNESANFVGTLEFDERDIVLDPFATSPLTALADIQTPVKGKFRVAIKGKPAQGVQIERAFDHFGAQHELPVLGLYENYRNEVKFIFMTKDNKERCSKTVTIQTHAIENKPALDIKVIKNTFLNVYNGLYFVSNLRLAFDQAGEIRWYYGGDEGMFFGKLRNGNFIVADDSRLNFFEVTMLGQPVKKYHVPYALHHEIHEMPNGNLLVASHSPPGPPKEDVVVEVSRVSGMVVRSWDYNSILDPSRKPLPNAIPGDWLHINALYYDSTDNSIVISGRSQCAVVKIDYETSGIKWILANPKEWAAAFSSFLLQPVNTQGNPIDVSRMDFWSYGQHAVHRLRNGNLLLYDNGDFRGFYDDPNVPANSYTRIVEYEINEEQKTVELVWSFDNNKSVFTRFTGYTEDLKNTRLAAYMFASTNTPKIVEVDRNKSIVYEATINRGLASYYRAIKLDVYSGIAR